MDPRTAVAQAPTVERVIADTLVLPRFRTLLLLTFAAKAFVLALIGIYAKVAYVSRRARAGFDAEYVAHDLVRTFVLVPLSLVLRHRGRCRARTTCGARRAGARTARE